MSYPQGAPGGPGQPSAQQANAHFAAPAQQVATIPESGVAGASKLPAFLAAAIAALGLLVYLASFGPQFTAGREFFITPFRLDLTVFASVLAALVAGVGLLPKQTARPALVAVLSLLSFLLVVSIVLTAPNAVTIGWGLYLVVAFTAIQTIVGFGALLLDAGIITAPAPRPRYEQPPQYGQYPGAYYGQYPGKPQQGAPAHQQRPVYPPQYGASGYPGAGPSTGGFSAVAPSGEAGEAGPGGESGPPTPPTGSPAYGQPKPGNAPMAEAPTQHQSASSSQSEQSSS
ncbi:MAG: DUF5336 domain-containing protein [Actinomycetia bacterium]|nr:DUF5336 domain-containing protein [Actinomycetes bacterium]